MASVPILDLDPEWNIKVRYRLPIKETVLNDGYKVKMPLSFSPIKEWDVSRTGINKADITDLISVLKLRQGVFPFKWRPNDSEVYEQYICDTWDSTLVSPDCYRFSATFRSYLAGECVEFETKIPENEILNFLDGADQFLSTYTKDTKPLMLNSQYNLVNSFHDVLGRGGYFPASSGTSEGQAVGIKACIEAYRATGDISWRNRAVNMGNAYLQYFYNVTTPPDNPTDLFIPHWLVNVKENFPTKGKIDPGTEPINGGYFGVTVSFSNGIGVVSSGSPNFGENLSDLYKVYSLDGQLLWQNIYSTLVSGTEYEIEYWVSNLELKGSNFRIYPDTASSAGTLPTATSETAGTVKITSPYTGDLKVIYAAYEPSVPIPVNGKFDAYPFWRSVS